MQGRIENEKRINNLTEKKLVDLPDYVAQWYNSLIASYKTATTCKEYISKVGKYLKSINKDTKNITPDLLTTESIEHYFKEIQYKITSKGKTEQTSHSYRQMNYFVLSDFFEFMVERNYINNNPMSGNTIKIDRRKDDIKRIQLTKEDFIAILNAVDNNMNYVMRARDLSILCIFMTTGIRETALHNINVEDIDFDNSCLYVIDKGDKPIKYVLNNKTINAIKEWMSVRDQYNKNNLDCLFLSQKNTRITPLAISNIIGKYSKEGIGYKLSPHKLRAGFCSIMYKETGDIEFVRRVVGHSNVATTQKYIVTDGSERTKSSSIMENLLY